MASALVGIGWGTGPAGALSPTENFIVAAHSDFLLRQPTTNELLLWDAYLAGASRQSMLTGLLEGPEFQNLWIVGVRYYYLGEVDQADPQFTADIAALNSTDDYVASEVSVLARTDYFNHSGGTNTAFVENLYGDVLLRPSDAPGLAYWVGRLNAATASRAYVANWFIRTTEAATRRVNGPSGAATCAATALEDIDALRSGTYCLVLDRLANSPDTSFWAGQLAGTSQLPTLWASIGSSTEYYNNSQP